MQPAPSYLRSMNPVDAVVPTPTSVVRGAHATAVERWASELRCELARLGAVLDKLQAEAERAEGDLEAARAVAATPSAPASFRSSVDAILAAGMARFDAELAVARAEAAAVIAMAVKDATGVLVSAGADQAVLERFGPTTPPRTPELRRPRSAVELWSAMAAGAALGAPHAGWPDAGSPHVDPLAAVALRVDELFETDAACGDAAVAYDAFWSEATHPPVRERLRRLANRGQQ